MGVIIREYAAVDAQRVTEVLREVMPYVVTSAPLVHAQATASPARQCYRLLLAEEDDGRLLGCVRAGLFAGAGHPGAAFANVTVRPGACGRGAGGALLAAAEAHLAAAGATSVHTWATDLPASHSFAARRGYRRGRSATFLRLDLAAGGRLPGAPALPYGRRVELLPATYWAGDPRPLYLADVEAFRQEPGDSADDAISYADWRAITWDRPDFDPGLSTVAVADGEIAAFVLAQTDGEGRYWSGGTGTRHSHRGRGLAKAAKTHSLHRARAAGCREAYTGNDDGNAAMLAINRWLGYRPCATQWRYAHDLTPAGTRHPA